MLFHGSPTCLFTYQKITFDLNIIWANILKRSHCSSSTFLNQHFPIRQSAVRPPTVKYRHCSDWSDTFKNKNHKYTIILLTVNGGRFTDVVVFASSSELSVVSAMGQHLLQVSTRQGICHNEYSRVMFKFKVHTAIITRWSSIEMCFFLC